MSKIRNKEQLNEDWIPDDEEEDEDNDEGDDDVQEIVLEESDIEDMEVYIPLDRAILSDISSGDDSDDVHDNEEQQEQVVNNNDENDEIILIRKRKRFLLTPTPPATQTPQITDAKQTHTVSVINKSVSQLSISQKNPKKKKNETTTTTAAAAVEQSNEESNQTNPIGNFKPNYLKVSDRTFKQMLSNSIDHGLQIVQCLDTKEKLHSIRQTTELTNNLYFKGLQRQLWQDYDTISSRDQAVWQLKISKSYARQHSVSRMYKPQKSFIHQRLRAIQQQLQQVGNDLHQHLLQLQQSTRQWQPTIDFEKLSHAINECVKNGQQRLKKEFDFKKELLTFNLTDHQLLNRFYQLKPNETLIQLAKTIWQITSDELKIKEQQEILRQLIYLKRLPTKTEKIVNELVRDNQITLANPYLNLNQRANFASRCSKTIIQCKFNLMLIQLDEFENVLRQHQFTLHGLQQQLLKLNKENSSIYTNALLDAIEERRQATVNRLFYMRQYKLKTFFDEAPAMDSTL